jgi:hypothetical protein
MGQREILKRGDYFENLGIDGQITIYWKVNKVAGIVLAGWTWYRNYTT